LQFDQKNPLSLDLPSIFWKQLVGIQLDKRDLREIDLTTSESLERIEIMSEDTFKSTIFETFTTLLSDKSTVVELKQGGGEIFVSYENRHEYTELKWKCRLNESKLQMSAVLRGMETIVPLSLLNIFTPKDIKYLICGKSDIDLGVLKKHTRYRGVKETDLHIQFFWKVLESFSSYERTLFLRFAWGRERLPNENDFVEEMKIFPNIKENQDKQLPRADTCFFQCFVTCL